ncbi:MAG: patatin-like phospholipase family protein [Rhizobiales bacterium]|nr:patatin-like phospholipase family protein [Hyphomicrobiales bacterium]
MSRVKHTDDDLQRWFPDQREPPAEGTFEMGLVLAGAASAGAYTAGVLDFLYEALDEWRKAHEADVAAGREGKFATVPSHRVVIRLITGASAGGMNGAISAATLGGHFPHVHRDMTPEARRENPFYRAWVTDVDVRAMLDTSDLASGVRSLLNCGPLEEIVATTLSTTRDEKHPARDWLANPLSLILTVTNLRGVPYAVAFRGGNKLRHGMALHRDHMSFAMEGLGQGPYEPPPPDFARLGPVRSDAAWHCLGQAALATGAFPLALKPRTLERPIADYDFRHPIFDNAGRVDFDKPSWPWSPGEDEHYKFLCIDGGATNNEPFDLAHAGLAGVVGFNPRKGEEANRAVVMIDPFVDSATLGPDGDASLIDTMIAFGAAYKDQARYSSGDWALIQSDDVYSRFIVAPSRNGIHGSAAITSGAVSAFMGFFSEEYRHHDFMLGRRNCQWFLQSVFTLPEDNPLFRNRLPMDRTVCADKTGQDVPHFQIIPVVGSCAKEEELPEWPVRSLKLDEGLRHQLRERIDTVTDLLVAEQLHQLYPARRLWSPMLRAATKLYLSPGVRKARKAMAERVYSALEDGIAAIDRGRPEEQLVDGDMAARSPTAAAQGDTSTSLS